MFQNQLFSFPATQNTFTYSPVGQDTASITPEFQIDFPGPVSLHATVTDMQVYGHFTGEKRKASDYDWMTILLLVAFLLLTIAKYNFGKRMGQLLKASLFPRAVAQLYREGNPFNDQVTILLGIIFLFTSSLFIYVLLYFFDWLPVGLIRNEWLYLGILAVNSFYWLAKTIVTRMLGHIFKTREATGNYLLNNLLFNLTLGIFLLFLLPFVIYTGSVFLLKIVLVLTVIILVYRVLRGIVIGIGIGLSISRFPIFYLILYLCMIEVAPLLIILKLFLN